MEALLPLLSVPLALLIGAGMLVVLNANPLQAYRAMLDGAIGSQYAITQTLVKATPLLLVGLGVVIAFRGGIINIGGEGQILVGALGAAAVALYVPVVPSWLHMILCLLGGTLAGAVWGGIPGALKAKLEVNEILTTIMMNAIALQLTNYLIRGPMMDPQQVAAGTHIAQTAEFPRAVWLAKLVPQTLLHSGAILALILAILVYVFMWRTTIGFRIRAVGLSTDASRYAGIPVRVFQALSLTLGGALAGLAGAIEVLGISHRVVEGISGGYGFTGIVVALFGGLHPLGTIPASILFGGLLVGADKMQRAVQVPSAMIQAILGLVVVFVVSSEIWSRRRAHRRESRG
jgi:general nucleoside transport system permease protein